MNKTGAKPKKALQNSEGQKHGGGVRASSGSGGGGSVEKNGAAADYHGGKPKGQKRQKLSSSGRSGPVLDSPQYNTYRNETNSISLEQFKALSTDDKLTTMFSMLSEVRTTNEMLQNFETELNHVATETARNNSRIKTLEYHSIDSEARGRRLNLIFRGIPEIYLEEDCFALVKDFLKTSLQIQNADEILMQRAHRLGAPVRGNQRQKSRPIIVCFTNQSDVQRILANASKLKGQPELGVNRDYPNEIIKARSRIWPRYKQLKKDYPRRVFIGYPAKLIVKGEVV